jgi:hypothetical protein
VIKSFPKSYKTYADQRPTGPSLLQSAAPMLFSWETSKGSIVSNAMKWNVAGVTPKERFSQAYSWRHFLILKLKGRLFYFLLQWVLTISIEDFCPLLVGLGVKVMCVWTYCVLEVSWKSEMRNRLKVLHMIFLEVCYSNAFKDGLTWSNVREQEL